jgi:hypothetical protein
MLPGTAPETGIEPATKLGLLSKSAPPEFFSKSGLFLAHKYRKLMPEKAVLG